jgi:hypothetical protein
MTGKPSGWGGPWWDSEVKAGEYSDPFLMTGFDKKSVYVKAKTANNKPAKLTVEVDFLGDGTWEKFEEWTIGDSFAWHAFPDAFSAHWVRLKLDSDAKATAHFHYR